MFAIVLEEYYQKNGTSRKNERAIRALLLEAASAFTINATCASFAKQQFGLHS